MVLRINKATISEVIALLFMILWLYTGISKLTDYTTFKEQLSESPLLKNYSSIIAIGIPSIEIVLSLMLLIPAYRLKGFTFSLILMALFTVYIIIILISSSTLPCSCGGIIAELSWPQHIAFNILFLLLGILGVKLEKGNLFKHKH